MPKYVIEREIHGADKLMSYQLKGLHPTLWAIVLLLVMASCSKDEEPPLPQQPNEPETESFTTFTFLSNGTATNGKIYLPDSYETNDSLPAIYLVDFKERSLVAKDEFEKVIRAVNQITEFDALVVTLVEHLDIHSQPEDFQGYYTIFKDLASYVDSNYTNNTSRTFIARGGEAGIVIMTLFLENPETSVFDNFIATDSPVRYNSLIRELIKSGDFPQEKGNKRFHFSFSDSNDFNSCTNMIKEINEAEYTWLQFESIKYTGEYTTTYPAAFAAGIKFVYKQ